MTTITFRAIVEVLGKPKEHVEETLKQYVQKLKDDGRYLIVSEEYAEIEPKEELWSTFVELEVRTKTLKDLVTFCFDYMPSLIEILEPEELSISDVNLSEFLSDLQNKLHSVDMIAKEMRMEHDSAVRNASIVLRNYILFLLANKSFASEEISKLTGVEQEKVEDFLDKLIDEKKVDLKEGKYFLVQNE